MRGTGMRYCPRGTPAQSSVTRALPAPSFEGRRQRPRLEGGAGDPSPGEEPRRRLTVSSSCGWGPRRACRPHPQPRHCWPAGGSRGPGDGECPRLAWRPPPDTAGRRARNWGQTTPGRLAGRHLDDGRLPQPGGPERRAALVSCHPAERWPQRTQRRWIVTRSVVTISRCWPSRLQVIQVHMAESRSRLKARRRNRNRVDRLTLRIRAKSRGGADLLQPGANRMPNGARQICAMRSSGLPVHCGNSEGRANIKGLIGFADRCPTEWAASSAGRAPRSQRGGRRFEPCAVHQPSLMIPREGCPPKLRSSDGGPLVRPRTSFGWQAKDSQ